MSDPTALPNDNREPAGTLRDGVLSLRLEARKVTWSFFAGLAADLNRATEVLNRDAALVVTRGVYTVRYRDGRTMVRPQVVTTAWSRGRDGWRMVHLHESWRTGGQP